MSFLTLGSIDLCFIRMSKMIPKCLCVLLQIGPSAVPNSQVCWIFLSRKIKLQIKFKSYLWSLSSALVWGLGTEVVLQGLSTP